MAPTTATVRLVETADSELEAIRKMHAHAARLRSMRITGRYGVYVEKYQHTRRTNGWGVFLVDRGQHA